MKQHYELKVGLVYDPDHVEERMRTAGFIDITVHRYNLHIGEWGDDPISRNCGRLGGIIFSGSAGPLMEGMSYFMPDDDERLAFIQRVEEEMRNSDHHLYSPL